MAFFIQYGSGLLPAAGALAANSGAYQTGQDQFRNQLAANQDYRAQQAQDFSQQQSQDQLDFQRDSLDATNAYHNAEIRKAYDLADEGYDKAIEVGNLNNSAREALAEKRAQDAQELQDLRIKEQTQRLTVQEADRAQRLDTRLKATAAINDNNWDNKWSMNDSDWQWKQSLADEHAKAQDDLRTARTADQAAAAKSRMDEAARKFQISQQISDLKSQRVAAIRTVMQNARVRMRRVNPDEIRAATAAYDAQIRTLINSVNQSGNGGFPDPTDLSPMMGDGAPVAPQGGGGQSGDYGNYGQPMNPAAVQAPRGAAPSQQGAQPAGAGQPAGIQVVSQTTHQVLSEMPTASREAIRIEVKNRLLRQGIDPQIYGIQ